MNDMFFVKFGRCSGLLLFFGSISLLPSFFVQGSQPGSAIEFELKRIPFQLENGVTAAI